MIKKFDSWLAKLPNWLGTLIFLAIVTAIVACGIILGSIFNKPTPTNIQEIPHYYSFADVAEQYSDEEVEEFVARYNYDHEND